jgi:hypothetical protein
MCLCGLRGRVLTPPCQAPACPFPPLSSAPTQAPPFFPTLCNCPSMREQMHPAAAVPCALSAATHSLMGSALAAYWRSRPVEMPVAQSGVKWVTAEEEGMYSAEQLAFLERKRRGAAERERG